MISSLTQNSYKYLQIKNKFINRNYGIDLLRIVSMINILNLHLNLFSGQLHLSFTSSKYFNIWRLEVFSFWAVDGFGLISGIVGYKIYKFSNLIYLWFQAWFYSTFISLYLFFIKKKYNINLILSLLPLLNGKQWYVNAYFSMYLLLPFINYGINLLNRKVYRNLIIFFFFFFSFYDLIGNILGRGNVNFLIHGYSSIWLTLLYIIGAYFGKYIIIEKNKNDIKKNIFYILIYIIFSFLSSEIYFKLIKIKSKVPNKLLISYISPTMVIQAISLIMFFSKLNINFKWNIKIISFLTPLTFSVQLIHLPLFQSKIKIIIILFKYVKLLKRNLIFFKIYGLSILLYFIFVTIDYFRLLIFKLFKIREICLLIEKKSPLLFDKFLDYLNI